MNKTKFTSFMEVVDWCEGKTKCLNIYVTSEGEPDILEDKN